MRQIEAQDDRFAPRRSDDYLAEEQEMSSCAQAGCTQGARLAYPCHNCHRAKMRRFGFLMTSVTKWASDQWRRSEEVVPPLYITSPAPTNARPVRTTVQPRAEQGTRPAAPAPVMTRLRVVPTPNETEQEDPTPPLGRAGWESMQEDPYDFPSAGVEPDWTAAWIEVADKPAAEQAARVEPEPQQIAQREVVAPPGEAIATLDQDGIPADVAEPRVEQDWTAAWAEVAEKPAVEQTVQEATEPLTISQPMIMAAVEEDSATFGHDTVPLSFVEPKVETQVSGNGRGFGHAFQWEAVPESSEDLACADGSAEVEQDWTEAWSEAIDETTAEKASPGEVESQPILRAEVPASLEVGEATSVSDSGPVGFTEPRVEPQVGVNGRGFAHAPWRDWSPIRSSSAAGPVEALFPASGNQPSGMKLDISRLQDAVTESLAVADVPAPRAVAAQSVQESKWSAEPAEPVVPAVPEAAVTIALSARPFLSYAQLNAFHSTVQALPGVKQANARGFSKGVLELEVTYVGQVPLGLVLPRLVGFSVQVSSETRDRIDLTVEEDGGNGCDSASQSRSPVVATRSGSSAY